MNIFPKPFHDVTFADVVAFCQQKHPESTTLDYKREIPRDLAKHFATFSNTLGGVIVVGVEEDPRTGDCTRPASASSSYASAFRSVGTPSHDQGQTDPSGHGVL